MFKDFSNLCTLEIIYYLENTNNIILRINKYDATFTSCDSNILIFNSSRNTLAILRSKGTADTRKKNPKLIEDHQCVRHNISTKQKCTTCS